jgi:hypothetical protein
VDPSYEERRAAARKRLLEAFNPQTKDETRWVEWLLSNLIPAEADLFSAMVERRIIKLYTPVAELRRLAWDRSLLPPDALRRLRDAVGKFDGLFSEPDPDEEL